MVLTAEERKAKEKAREQTPERKAKRKDQRERPENNAKKKEQAEKLAIASLNMRIIELEKPIYEPITTITTDRSWSKFAILGIGIVVFLIILRRRT